MTIRATIAIDTADFDLGEVLTAHDTFAELTQFIPIDDTLVPYFWAENLDLDAYEAEVRADPRVAQLVHLNEGAGRRLYQIEWADNMDGFLEYIHTPELLVESGRGTNDRWVFRIRAQSREPLAAFQAACADEGIVLQVQNAHHNPDDPERPLYGLTDKQQEALLIAQANGYFEIPQEKSLTELADEVGISRQSFSRRLNRGLNTLLINTLCTAYKL